VWFVDIGSGRLTNGKADIAFDSEFAPLVKRRDYHVWLTPLGDTKGLYVSRRTEVGFSVAELQNGTGNLEFSYQIYAKRSDVDAQRLARTKRPKKAPEIKVDRSVIPPPRR
jgi:hypothetical protein